MTYTRAGNDCARAGWPLAFNMNYSSSSSPSHPHPHEVREKRKGTLLLVHVQNTNVEAPIVVMTFCAASCFKTVNFSPAQFAPSIGELKHRPSVYVWSIQMLLLSAFWALLCCLQAKESHENLVFEMLLIMWNLVKSWPSGRLTKIEMLGSFTHLRELGVWGGRSSAVITQLLDSS